MVEKIHCFWQVLLTEKYHKQATKNVCIKEYNCCQLMLEIFGVATMSICSIYLIKTILNNNQTKVITISKYMMVTWHIINFGLEKKKVKSKTGWWEKYWNVTLLSNFTSTQCLTATTTMHNASQQLPPCTMMKTTHQMINGLYTTIYLHLLQPTSTCPNDASRHCLGVTYVFFFFFSFCLFFNYTTCSFNQHPLTWCIHLHPPYPMFVETMFQDIVWA